MQLHQLQRKNKLKRARRIGRGGKRGSSSGRGMKGQKSRAGRKFKPIIRELIKRYPKLKGQKQKSKTKGQKSGLLILNLEILNKVFSDKERITPSILLEKGIISKIRKETPQVKILGKGKITKALTFEDCQVSESAKKKIEKAGGQIK